MDERIAEECEKLGMARNAWIVHAIDKELRRAAMERAFEDDPYVAKEIISKVDVALDKS